MTNSWGWARDHLVSCWFQLESRYSHLFFGHKRFPILFLTEEVCYKLLEGLGVKECRRKRFLSSCITHHFTKAQEISATLLLHSSTTCLIKPMNTGIETFRISYWNAVNKYVLQQFQLSLDARAFGATFKISVFDAFYMAKQAWHTMRADAIANCFAHPCKETSPMPAVPWENLPWMYKMTE